MGKRVQCRCLSESLVVVVNVEITLGMFFSFYVICLMAHSKYMFTCPYTVYCCFTANEYKRLAEI